VTPEGARATGEELADDIAAIMDHHRTGAAHLLGISMGGSIALMLSLCHPQMVRSQVAAVSVARIPYPSRTTFMLETTRLMQDAGVPHALVMRDALIGLWGEEVFPHTDVIDFVVNAPPDPWEQTRAGFDLQIDALRRYDIRARLGDIHTPTLIVSSPDDIIVPTHFQRELAHGIPGAEFKEYPGGHVFMMLPMYYQSFVDDVVAFWEKHS
jgi:3-oxoadipate enol-lactonase